MSSVAITGNAAGAGVFTIASPNSGSSFTATLPAATTTLVGTDATQTLTNKTLTTPNINSAQFATVSGTAPLYAARAWVNFNGTGTVAINANGNVSSITDNGTGDYTVNFTTSMPDANYSLGYMNKPTVAQSSEINVRGCNIKYNVSPTTSACRIVTQNGSNLEDYEIVSVSVFR